MNHSGASSAFEILTQGLTFNKVKYGREIEIFERCAKHAREAAAGADERGGAPVAPAAAAGEQGLLEAADVQGNDIKARIARTEILLADRNVANAMSELEGVGGATGETLSPWLIRAQGHLDAHDALAVIEAQAIARLLAEGGS